MEGGTDSILPRAPDQPVGSLFAVLLSFSGSQCRSLQGRRVGQRNPGRECSRVQFCGRVVSWSASVVFCSIAQPKNPLLDRLTTLDRKK